MPHQEVWQIFFARDGTMWVVLNDTIIRLKPGATRFEATGAPHLPPGQHRSGCAGAYLAVGRPGHVHPERQCNDSPGHATEAGLSPG